MISAFTKKRTIPFIVIFVILFSCVVIVSFVITVRNFLPHYVPPPSSVEEARSKGLLTREVVITSPLVAGSAVPLQIVEAWLIESNQLYDDGFFVRFCLTKNESTVRQLKELLLYKRLECRDNIIFGISYAYFNWKLAENCLLKTHMYPSSNDFTLSECRWVDDNSSDMQLFRHRQQGIPYPELTSADLGDSKDTKMIARLSKILSGSRMREFQIKEPDGEVHKYSLRNPETEDNFYLNTGINLSENHTSSLEYLYHNGKLVEAWHIMRSSNGSESRIPIVKPFRDSTVKSERDSVTEFLEEISQVGEVALQKIELLDQKETK